ncbi:hypothetical protein P7K49_026408 [Saguinus oedipus]|uniref:Uncharacterized protein n=1 Tax=Saguinus oedipus TaxID=9490 RepID=A0ABQ9UD49_SAGOE|nr:hypothetical protein P7K49_026408 [Saguinus oedipus]
MGHRALYPGQEPFLEAWVQHAPSHPNQCMVEQKKTQALVKQMVQGLPKDMALPCLSLTQTSLREHSASQEPFSTADSNSNGPRLCSSLRKAQRLPWRPRKLGDKGGTAEPQQRDVPKAQLTDLLFLATGLRPTFFSISIYSLLTVPPCRKPLDPNPSTSHHINLLTNPGHTLVVLAILLPMQSLHLAKKRPPPTTVYMVTHRPPSESTLGIPPSNTVMQWIKCHFTS